MLKVKYSNKFEKDYKRIKKRNYDLSKLRKVIELLANQIPLPANYMNSRSNRNTRGQNVVK